MEFIRSMPFYFEYVGYHINIAILILPLAIWCSYVLVRKINYEYQSQLNAFWHRLDSWKKLLYGAGYVAVVLIAVLSWHWYSKDKFISDLQNKCNFGNCSDEAEAKLERLGARESDNHYQPLIR